MRTMKIVADSSANLLELPGVAFASAPMKVITAQREFVDDEALDVEGMVDWFATYKGRSKSSCPNPADWLEAFGDGDDIFCVTITSGLSGSYNTACAAKQMYEAEHEGRRVFVIDSLSAGPELELIVEELMDLIAQGLDYEQICQKIQGYTQKTGLLFMLESLKNFAANGRVSPAVAKIAGILGIRLVGEAKSLDTIMSHLKSFGLKEGKVRISHCRNEGAAQRLREKIRELLPKVDVKIGKCRGLCSFYAENGGLLVGFEKM